MHKENWHLTDIGHGCLLTRRLNDKIILVCYEL